MTRTRGEEQVFDGWTRDEYNAMVAAEDRNFGTDRENAFEQRVNGIAECLRDSFAPPLDEGTSMHIARKIVALDAVLPSPKPPTASAPTT